jgi:phosphatidylglycerol---prolipoprotein diacylglyceryl transferase
VHPELFHIGRFTMNSYGLMMALAFVSAGIAAYWQFKKRGVKRDFIYPLLIAAIVGGLLGAKIHYIIINPEQFPGNLLSG